MYFIIGTLFCIWGGFLFLWFLAHAIDEMNGKQELIYIGYSLLSLCLIGVGAGFRYYGG